jgi:hypothetical protein
MAEKIAELEIWRCLCPNLKSMISGLLWVIEDTNPESAIPATCAEGHPINTDPQTTDPIFMTRQNTNTFSFKGIPNITCPIVISSKKDTTRDREGDWCDTTKNVVVGECIQLTISTDVKQAAGSIVGTSGKSVTVREEAKKQNVVST